MEYTKRAGFFEVSARDRIFVLGRSMSGTVTQVKEHRGRRTGVNVQFDDGPEVTYQPRSFNAFYLDEQLEKVVEEGKQNAEDKQGEPNIVRRAALPKARRIVRSRMNAGARHNGQNRAVPMPKDVRPLPDIPGPPVARPKHGVWDHKQ